MPWNKKDALAPFERTSMFVHCLLIFDDGIFKGRRTRLPNGTGFLLGLGPQRSCHLFSCILKSGSEEPMYGELQHLKLQPSSTYCKIQN